MSDRIRRERAVGEEVNNISGGLPGNFFHGFDIVSETVTRNDSGAMGRKTG